MYTIIKPKSLKELKSSLSKINTKDKIIVQGGSEDINRFSLENNKISILLSPEKNYRKDHTHYRNSGLNQVLCKLAKKSNKSIGIDFNSLLDMSQEERIKTLGRIEQNIRLCNKYKVNVKIVNTIKTWKDERSTKDLKSLATILGLNIKESSIIKVKT
ncbi:hypothetical protein CL617_05865 [archaeon]|nr:hypothetical protein [archaeon]|tara:strand:- start:2713 stop:3186 length:474 start_codon:yes stop_codon:yes gene_type:complete